MGRTEQAIAALRRLLLTNIDIAQQHVVYQLSCQVRGARTVPGRATAFQKQADAAVRDVTAALRQGHTHGASHSGLDGPRLSRNSSYPLRSSRAPEAALWRSEALWRAPVSTTQSSAHQQLSRWRRLTLSFGEARGQQPSPRGFTTTLCIDAGDQSVTASSRGPAHAEATGAHPPLLSEPTSAQLLGVMPVVGGPRAAGICRSKPSLVTAAGRASPRVRRTQSAAVPRPRKGDQARAPRPP